MSSLDNMKFNVKSILATERQKDLIDDLICQIQEYEDYDCDIDYGSLTKKEASEIIGDLIERLNELHDEFDEYVDYWDYGDR